MSGWAAGLCFGGSPSCSASMAPDGAPSFLPTTTLPELPACLPGTSRSFSLGVSSSWITPDCGCTKAWGHEAAEAWQVGGAVPCPIPL